jgi:hypothetical protein
MRHCTLFVPDLLPAALHPAPGDALRAPHLATLLARANSGNLACDNAEAWLCTQFGVARQHDWPVAALTLGRDGGDAGTGYWLRCDPVHLYMRQNRMYLSDAAGAPSAGESAALIAALNAHFGNDGLLLHAGTSGRWYLRAQAHTRLVTQPLSSAINRDLDSIMPGGEDSRYWRSLLNEMQMLLHTHPVNAEREARGLPAFNSLWLWGGGTAVAAATTAYTQVWSDDALACALAALCAAPCAALADGAENALRTDGHTLVVVNALRDHAPDFAAWQAALEKLEQAWMAPCLRALKNGRIKTLHIVTTGGNGGRQFVINGAHLWRWWRRVRPLGTYV